MVAVAQERDVDIEPVRLNLPVFGSYNSAEEELSEGQAFLLLQLPPTIRTRPSFRSVAVWFARAKAIEPVGVNEPVLESYNSADATSVSIWPMVSAPPAMRTLPFPSNVAVA
jgi:hypothetical protein